MGSRGSEDKEGRESAPPGRLSGSVIDQWLGPLIQTLYVATTAFSLGCPIERLGIWKIASHLWEV